MAKQPFYHRVEILFTATSDLSDVANDPKFVAQLKTFLKMSLGREVIGRTVELDSPVTAEPGDPSDLG